jgi:hypothetical protein
MWKSILLVGSLLSTSAAHAELAIKQDAKGKVVSILGLYDTPEGCLPSDMTGVIVKREFREDAMVLSGFVLEASDGTRSFINVIAIPEKLDMASKGNLIRGLQLFSKVGRSVSTVVYACGAAGRTLFLDAIK